MRISRSGRAAAMWAAHTVPPRPPPMTRTDDPSAIETGAAADMKPDCRLGSDMSTAALLLEFSRHGQREGARALRAEGGEAVDRRCDEGELVLVEDVVDVHPRLVTAEEALPVALADIDIAARDGVVRDLLGVGEVGVAVGEVFRR